MNGPDAGCFFRLWRAVKLRKPVSPTEYRRRIKSGAFFRDTDTVMKPFQHRDAPAGISGLPVKAALCPLSVQVLGKLMQKIHRLTDN